MDRSAPQGVVEEGDPVRLVVRAIRLPEDRAGVDRLDTSFTTSEIYAVVRDVRGFALERTKTALITKTYAVDDWQEERLWDMAWVACEENRIVGFAATRYEAWNRRLVIWHLYVDRGARRQGVARALLDAALSEGRCRGAGTVWLELSNINAPAIAAYRSLGFDFCGLDLELYRHTEASGEAALFMGMVLTD